MTKKLQRPWLVDARKKLGLSQVALARKLGISQNELSKIETGVRLRLDPQLAVAIGSELRMTREQVMFGRPQPKSVRILGKMQGDDEIAMYAAEERLELAGINLDVDVEGYRVDVDTLEPRFRRGDVLICRHESSEVSECHGLECVVEIAGHRYVRLVEPGESMRVVTLRPYRTTGRAFVDVTPSWLSPIIAFIPTRHNE